MSIRRSAASQPEPPLILAARARVIQILSVLIGVMALGVFVADLITGEVADALSFLSLVLAGVAAVSWLLLKYKHFAAVSWLVVMSLFVVGTAAVYFYGSVRTVGNYLIIAGPVAAGVFLSRRALFWTSLGAIGLMVVLGWAESMGWLLGRPTFETGARTWMMQAASLVGLSVMVYLNRTQMQLAKDLHLVESSQRLRVRLERDHSQERFVRVFRSSPTPIYVQSARTGTILNVNPAFERVMGYDRQSVVGTRDRAFWLPDHQHEAFMRSRATQLRTDWLPITGVCRDGSQVALFICSEMDEDPEDSLVITALRLREKDAGDVRVHRAVTPDACTEGEDLHA